MAWVKVASPRLSSTHEIELWLEQRAQNIAGNSSTVGYELGIRRISSVAGGYWNNNTSSASLSVNGTAIGVAGFTYDFRSNYYKTLSNGEISVPHNSDGTKTVSISGSVSMNGGNIPSGSTSGSLTLTTIPRTSSFTAPSSFNVGSAFTVTITRASTSFTHHLSLHDGSTALHWDGTTAATSRSLNVAANTIIARMSGVKSKAFTVRVDTYNGSTYIGSTSKSITANIPTSTFTAPSSFNVGSAFTVSISRVGSLTHWVELKDGSTNLYGSGNTVGTSVSPNIAADTLVAKMPGVVSKAFTVQVDTYNGSAWIGRQTKSITAYIPASTFTIPSSFTVGSAFTVSVSRIATQLTHWVELLDGSTNLYSSGNTVGTSVSPNIAADTLVGRMSGAESKVFTVQVDTYNGDTWIGRQTKSITAVIPASTFTIPGSFNVGSAFTASISRVGSSLTHRIELVDGSTSLYLTDATSSTSLSSTVPANTVLARMSGVKSKAFTVHLHTYNNGVWIAYTSKTITASIPTSTFTAPASFTMGNAFAVSISRVGSLTHAVELWDGSTNIYFSGNSVTTSGSVNVALSTLAARSPNSMSRTFRLDVDTYNGNLFIGKSSKNITAYVPSSVKPTFSAVSVSENVSTVASLVGAYVQTKSKLNLAITGASGIYGSTIRSYNITGVGHSANSSSTVTGYLSASGDQTITGTVTDSRGQTFSKSVVVNILPYTAPTLSDLSFRRTLPDKTEAPLGDNATVRASVKVHSLIVNGVQKNSIKYQVQSAQSGGSFADKANTTSTSLTKSYSDVWVGYSVDHSYNFRVRVGDVFGFGGWSVGVLPTGVVTQQWSSKTTSFGKMIDNTSYNVQVGTGGIQSDGPIIDKNGREVPGVKPIPGNDLNNAMAPGFYHWFTGVANSPTDWGSMVVTAWDGTGVGTAEQLVMKNGEMWIRGKNNAGSAWTAWRKI